MSILQFETLVLFMKLSTVEMHSRLFRFSYVGFSVSCFMLRYLVHLDYSYVQGHKYGCMYIVLHTCRPAPFLECAVFFSLHGFVFFVKIQVFLGV